MRTTQPISSALTRVRLSAFSALKPPSTPSSQTIAVVMARKRSMPSPPRRISAAMARPLAIQTVASGPPKRVSQIETAAARPTAATETAKS